MGYRGSIAWWGKGSPKKRWDVEQTNKQIPKFSFDILDWYKCESSFSRILISKLMIEWRVWHWWSFLVSANSMFDLVVFQNPHRIVQRLVFRFFSMGKKDQRRKNIVNKKRSFSYQWLLWKNQHHHERKNFYLRLHNSDVLGPTTWLSGWGSSSLGSPWQGGWQQTTFTMDTLGKASWITHFTRLITK